MDRVVDLASDVRREVADYVRGGDYKAASYFLENAEHHIYAMITIPDFDHPLLKKPQFVLIARILNEHVIIDVDITDRPLFEELMRCGIPREQIVQAYAGEQYPPAESEK